MRIIGYILTLILKTIRPLLGPATCLFKPSCSEFAYLQLQKESFLTAVITISKQIIKCHSFTR